MKEKKQSELKKHYIKMIHTLKRNYFIDDECRREYLKANYGKDSLSLLSLVELRQVLELVGYKPRKRAKKPKLDDRAFKGIGEFGTSSKAQIKTICLMWQSVARDKSPLALRGFIDRVVGRGRPLYLSQLSKEEASDVIVALKALVKHTPKTPQKA